MLQLSISWLLVLQDVVVNIIKSLVINDESFIRVFKELMSGKDCVVLKSQEEEIPILFS
jgi:hypothetical protein